MFLDTLCLRCVTLFLLCVASCISPGLAQSLIRIDSTFNSVGYHSIDMSPMEYNVQTGDNILLNPADNKYIVRGFVNPLGAYIKFNRDGSLDMNFNNSGALLQPGSERYSPNFFIDGSGRMVNAVGKATLTLEMGFMRTLPSGTPDPSFGTDGILFVPGTSQSDGYFLPLPNGKFLMVSNYWEGTSVGIKLQQFTSGYALDLSFGNNGEIIHRLGFYDMFVRRVQVFDDGKILIAGTGRSSPPEDPDYDYNAVMVRCLPTGAIDPSFGDNGLLMPYARLSLDDQFNGCYILKDQKFLGYGHQDGTGYIARYNYNGSVDSSFGFMGRIFIREIQFVNVQQQRDGKLIGAGNYGFTIARVTEDGARDSIFGDNGVYNSPAPVNEGQPYASLLENDSTLLLTGFALNNSQSNNITTARYKIGFQPQVTGVKSRYCVDDSGEGTVINLPKPGSDTLVTVLLDKTIVLPIDPQGKFTFSAGTGNHSIMVQFTKGTNTWNETISFTAASEQPIAITTLPQAICTNSRDVLIEANVPCYWQGLGVSVTYPTSAILYKAPGSPGPQQLIAIRDNGGCGVTIDTLILDIVQLNPVITENDGVLSTTTHASTTYQWYWNNSLITGASSHQYSPTKNGNYTVTESLGNCSKTSTSFSVTGFFEPLPVPEVRAIAKEYCQGISLQQGRLLNPPAEPATILITIDGGTPVNFFPEDSSFYFSIEQPGNHTISVTYTSGDQIENKDTLFLVNPIPTTGGAPTQSGNKLTIPVTGTSYQWYVNGNEISGAALKDYTINFSGQYSYTYSVNGCVSGMSAILNASVLVITDTVSTQAGSISPNPAREVMYVSNLNENNTYHLQIVDFQGNLVKELAIAGQKVVEVYIGNLAPGTYFIRMRNNSQQINMKTRRISVL